ncbi:MAG: hypothetical protein RBT65_14980 [Methanolobus sp.]|nr:hypothetical protein [Methanolobus sp.]
MIKITKVVFMMALTVFLLSGYSNADANETLNVDELTINVDELALPDFGPHIFEEIQNESWLIESRGTIPTITDNKEKLEWADKVTQCTMALQDEMDKYLYDGSPLFSFGGVTIDGYVEVGFNSATPDKVNDTLIDEIYSLIDTQCKKEGINDVPVVFMWAEMPTEETPGFTSIMLILCILVLTRIRR